MNISLVTLMTGTTPIFGNTFSVGVFATQNSSYISKITYYPEPWILQVLSNGQAT